MPWRADFVLAVVTALPTVLRPRIKHTGPTATLTTENQGYVTAHDSNGHTTGCAVQNTELRWTVYNRAGDVLREDVTTVGAMMLLRGINDPQTI